MISSAWLLGLGGLVWAQEGPDILVTGHWVEVRGALDDRGRFVGEKVELSEPARYELLIGTVPGDQTDPARFTLLGQVVETSPETSWENLEPGPLAGRRVKVEGRWHGPPRLAAREIAPRGEGRDRIGGRIDELRRVEGGWQARLMIFDVFLPEGVEVEHVLPIEQIPLAPARKWGQPTSEAEDIERDEDDVFGLGLELSETLRLSGQIETEARLEDDFDLGGEADDGDREDYELSLRARLTWTPGDALSGLTEVRYNQLWRDDEEDGSDYEANGLLGETFLLWRDVLGQRGFDLAVGRQDFDDLREWLYDQNLDALRMAWIRPALRLDLSASTTLTDGSEFDQETVNWIAYLSNNDRRKHLAAWALYRDTDDVSRDLDGNADGNAITDNDPQESLHFGLRAIGRWLPQNKSWFELAYLSGERPLADPSAGAIVEVDVSAWGYDLGTTWSPPFARPFYFTLGYALGSGDGNPASGTDHTFHQTGLNDNTARFGGVTSFQYYGELLDPELSNLGIFTAGLGALVAERTSVDLVYHDYLQDDAQPVRLGSVSPAATGLEADVGAELDLVFGYRRWQNWDLELIAAWFHPGDAFAADDDAYLGKVQLRYRF